MQINSVYDPVFKPYGQVHDGYNTKELLDAMLRIRLPEQGTSYEPSIQTLEDCAIFVPLCSRAYGYMPIQIGMCWGHNTMLNCLEYHRDSEINIGTHDFVLLLAKQEEIEDGVLDTEKVKAFRVPAGVVVEVYATTLHYAPCHCNDADGFRVAVILPRGTNQAMPRSPRQNGEDARLWAQNKWLLAHPDSAEAKQHAYVGLKGSNLDITK